MLNSHGANMWKVNGGLNGTPDANSPDEAMSHNSHTFSNIANIFMSHYARISKLHVSKADLDLNHHSKKQLDQPSADDESCTAFQKGEKDESFYEKDEFFLKSLGPLELQESLSIFNSSFSRAPGPGTWIVGIIIPLL